MGESIEYGKWHHRNIESVTEQRLSRELQKRLQPSGLNQQGENENENS